ncbi:hypothetical protein GCK32_012564, partial [Trichostrongylus colubriformis]
RQGFLDISPNIASKPGRLCKPLQNECALKIDDCARDGGICEDTPDSFLCRCAINYLDVSFDRVNRPGRKCKRYTEDSYMCACPPTHIDLSADPVNRPGRKCLLRINECTSGRHDCSPNADCMDTPESFKCRCRDDFVDESPDVVSRPGRICRPALVDECRLGKHDCHADAFCQDLPQGYTCRCKPEYLDQSPNRATHPGRMCVPRPTPPPPECRIDGPNQCKAHLNEVCRLVNSEPKCTCPMNYQRDSSGSCSVVNECQFPHLNDCHQHAQCIDQEEGYECRCNHGFMDRSHGRPGRICKQLIDECAVPGMNSCDRNARCIDEEEGYRCECRDGYLDVSPSPQLKGRSCRRLVNECRDPKLNDCDRNAKCRDTMDSYECECPPNSKDISPSPAFPGRVDECSTGRHTCSAQADCRDLEEGYTCECREGYVDRSPNLASQPGRVCSAPEVCPSNHECSSAAVCEPLGGMKYQCSCIQGYVDQSPSGQKGRICVR